MMGRNKSATKSALTQLVHRGNIRARRIWDRCNVCGVEGEGETVAASCGHAFHQDCIQDRRCCPVCGGVVEQAIPVYNNYN